MIDSKFGEWHHEGQIPDELFVEPRWYACYTRARAEKQAEAQLAARGLESFLPLVPRMRQWKDRKKLVPWPMFPGYVFGRFTLRDVHRVLSAPGVSTIVRAGDYPSPIADDEIANVRRFAEVLSAHGIAARAKPLFEVGQPVRIASGPCAGLMARVVQLRGRRRVVVGLTHIRMGVEVNVPVDQVAPLDAGTEAEG